MYTFVQPQCWTPTNYAIEWTVIPELDQPCDWSDFGYLEDCTFESIFLVGVHLHPIM